MGDVRFRQARAADAGAIVALKRAAIRQLAGWTYGDAQIEAWAPDDDALADFEAAIDHDRFSVTVAETDDGLAGYGVLNLDAQRIDAAYVDPAFARGGIATTLVRQLETSARLAGIDELEIVASHNATEFYAGLGYWRFGDTTRAIDGETLEFAVMRKSLDSNWPQ